MLDECTIRVVSPVLEQMASRIRHLTVDLALATQFDFSQSGPVNEAYEAKSKRWQEHRQEIDTAMDRIASILDAIRGSFVDVDSQLAGGLGAGGGGGGGGAGGW